MLIILPFCFLFHRQKKAKRPHHHRHRHPTRVDYQSTTTSTTRPFFKPRLPPALVSPTNRQSSSYHVITIYHHHHHHHVAITLLWYHDCPFMLELILLPSPQPSSVLPSITIIIIITTIIITNITFSIIIPMHPSSPTVSQHQCSSSGGRSIIVDGRKERTHTRDSIAKLTLSLLLCLIMLVLHTASSPQPSTIH